MKKFKKMKAFFLICTLTTLIAGCGIGSKLSRNIIGTWHGDLDVAGILSYELTKEMGFDEKIFYPDPVYSDISITFNKDNSGEMYIDKESLAQAVGKVIEPYASLLFGFDTEALVDLLLRSAAHNMDDYEGTIPFTYEVNDESNEVYLYFNDETSDKLIESDGTLEYENEIMGTKLVFKK